MRKVLTMVLIASILSFAAHATNPTFVNVQNYIMFNISQGQHFLFYVISTDSGGHYPLNFSYAKQQQPALFPSFSLKNKNSTAGIMNFTPTNWDVGSTESGAINYSIIFTVKDALPSNPGYATVYTYFRIVNVNDPPNITWWYPTQRNVSTKENYSIGFSFNYSTSDIDIPWGDRVNATWYYDNTVRNTSNRTNGSWRFYPDFCSAGQHNISLRVRDLNGTVDMHNWSLSINNTNRVPQINGTITNRSWIRGTNLTRNITLRGYLYDLDSKECSGTNRDNAVYSMNGSSHITAVINQTSTKVTLVPDQYWYGVEYVKFRLNDGFTTAYSNTVKLNVTFVNFPPVMHAIPNQTLSTGVRFEYKINVTHYDYTQQLYYQSNNSNIPINLTTGWINFTPTGAQIGIFFVNISVNDTIVSDSKIGKFTILNNTPPYIDPVYLIIGTEDVPLFVMINATDKDNDSMTFYDNSTWFNITTKSIGSGNATGKINYTPRDPDVGSRFVKVQVVDSRGAVNYTIFNFTIRDVNHKPVFSNIPDIVIKINRTYMLNITATDADLPLDILTFRSNSSFFRINEMNSTSPATSRTLINVSNISLVGTHYVNISVRDDDTVDPGYHSQKVRFIIRANRYPGIYPIAPRKVQEDHRLELFVNGYDLDNDTLTYDANTTMFDLIPYNSTSALINFTPDYPQIGNYSIRINVTDGFGAYNFTMFYLNITPYNDLPMFINLSANYSFYEDTNSIVYIYAWDEESNILYMWDNDTLFNMTRFDSTTYKINLTPLQRDAGNYSVNISLTDGTYNVSEVVRFRIIEVNDAPFIRSFFPNRTKVFGKENMSTMFNLTNVTDEEGDAIRFRWYMNGILKGSNRSLNYTPGFCEAGVYNLTAVAIDEHNASSRHYWNYTINNSDRGPYFNITIRNASFPEDTNKVNNITLNNHFYDPDFALCTGRNKDNLSYRVIGDEYVDAIIDSQSRVTLVPSNNWNGIEVVRFYLNDSHNIVYSNYVYYNVTPVPDPPTLRLIANYSTTVGAVLTIYANASDPDNDILRFKVNTSWFGITNISRQMGMINFTVPSGMVGNNSIKVTVNDSAYTASRTFRIAVTGNNSAPNITEVYPYGTPLSDYTVFAFEHSSHFPSGTKINVSENQSIVFNNTVTEPDGDTFTYRWLMDGTLKSTARALSYNFGFNTTRTSNVTLVVTDRLNNKATFYWNVSIRNVNRNPVFGQKKYTSYSDFLGGTVRRANITRQIGNITLAQSGSYFYNGSYTSPLIDFQTGPYSSVARQNLTVMRWTAVKPAGTNVTIRTRTSANAVSWSAWSRAYTNMTGSRMEFTANFTQNASPATWNTRYAQYMVNISTLNNSITPVIESVEIGFQIAGFVAVEGRSVSKWIDLDDYFIDQDNDTLNCNFTDIINGWRLRPTISADGYVDLSPMNGFSGTAWLGFNCSDADNGTFIGSNDIKVTVKSVPQEAPQTSSGGGGGASTKYIMVPRKEPINITKPVSLQLIVPKPFISTSDMEIIAPLELKNDGNVTLTGIVLKASTSQANVSLSFSENKLSQLKPHDKATVNLFIKTAFRITKGYQINITAESTDPKFSDTAMISINPFQMPQSLNDTVRFVKDLLSTNPECLELNEMMLQASAAIDDKNYQGAQEILAKVTDSCRYLISTKSREPQLQKAEEVGAIESVKKFYAANKGPIIIVSAAMLALIAYTSFMIYKGKRKTVTLQPQS